MSNCISVNLKKDKIVIKVHEDAKMQKIIDELQFRLPELKKLYKDDKTPIKVSGKILKDKEKEKIEELIKSQINVKVTFDSDEPKGLGLSAITKTFKKDIGVSETKFHRGSLRSGQRIEAEGSIVILGDVNSGAEVVASDNIVILGALRGLAHAGAQGNKNAIIAAGTVETVQIRISNIVKEMGKEELYRQAYIYIDNDLIVIE